MNEQWKQWALKKNPDLIDRKVIEDIKAEVQENINYNKKMNYQGIVAGLLLTLNIIDKHTNSVGKIDYRAYSDLYADLHDICMPIFEECYDRMEKERKAEMENSDADCD